MVWLPTVMGLSEGSLLQYRPTKQCRYYKVSGASSVLTCLFLIYVVGRVVTTDDDIVLLTVLVLEGDRGDM